MKVIILAAGRGKRLMPLTSDTPKSLVPVLGKPFIDYTLRSLQSLGLTDVVIVVGYRSDKYKEEIGDHYAGCNITYVDNDDYAINDNMTSFWLAKDYIGEGVLMINSDVVFEPQLVQDLLDQEGNSSAIFVDKTLPEASMKVRVEDDKVVEFGRNMKSNYRAIGIHKFTKEGAKNYFDLMEPYVTREENGRQIELPLMDFIKSNDLHAVYVNDYAWAEIDTPEELEEAHEVFQRIEKALESNTT